MNDNGQHVDPIDLLTTIHSVWQHVLELISTHSQLQQNPFWRLCCFRPNSAKLFPDRGKE